MVDGGDTSPDSLSLEPTVEMREVEDEVEEVGVSGLGYRKRAVRGKNIPGRQTGVN